MTSKEALETFQANVRRLYRHPFAKKTRKARFKYSWKASGQVTLRKVIRPPSSDVAGFAALLRGFMTNDDEWAVKRLPSVYRSIGASAFQQRKLKDYRQKLARWMNSGSGFGFSGRAYSNECILETYIYGSVLHQSRRSDFLALEHSPLTRDLFMHILCGCLTTYAGAMGAIYIRNQMVLAHTGGVLPLP